MIRTIIASIVLVVFTSVAITGLQPVYADCTSSNSAKNEVLKGIGETGTDCNTSGVDRFISGVIRIISYIAGIAAIIAIILSGFKYITSGGDTNKIASAKNTLIYALVGVVVAVLAQLLVNFAFTTANDAANPPKQNNSSGSNP